MFGSAILDVLIGLVLVYLLLSIACTALNEAISSLLQQRGKHLFEGVKNLLNDPDFTGLAQQIYSHGLVDGLSRDAADPKKLTRKPSYMPAGTFSLALIDILSAKGAIANAAGVGARAGQSAGAPQALQPASDPIAAANALAANLEKELDFGRSLAAEAPNAMANIQAAVEHLPGGHTKESLLVLLDKSRRDVSSAAEQVAAFQKNVENWFNDAMDRVSGWYKRWTQVMLLVLALGLVVLANADTLKIINRLESDPALRASLANAAQDVVKNNGSNADNPAVQAAIAKAESLGLPIGWSRTSWDEATVSPLQAITKLLGLLLTVLATSLGAPFWFDTLSRIANVRGSGPPAGPAKA